ncbi:hypothetical protein [Psychroserpens damuponensis]|uniref:hypothetical protein n=1 Tax=Psychroserpens damuponensis TaxID=943936 RepID=UPI0005900E34|nr:hypothetical protein [Psychroserpens damuponensis]
MIKKYYVVIIFFLINAHIVFAQNFDIPGEVLVNGNFQKGLFSNNIDNSNDKLSFKFTSDNKIINLKDKQGIVFKFDALNQIYQTLNTADSVKLYILLVEGKASLFSNIESNQYFIQNLSKDSKSIKLEDFNKDYKRNFGILSVVFEDCLEVRSQLKNESINKKTLITLTESYNKCESYTEGYQLTSKQKLNLKYKFQKTIYSFDFGGGIYFNSFESIVRDAQSSVSESNNTGFSVFAGINVSPSHFGRLRDKLYFDISLNYISTPAFENEFFDIERSSFLLNVSPTFYFRHQKKINPFVRVNFGLNFTDYDLKSNGTSIFSDISGSGTSFIYGFETGIQISKSFELVFLYQPKTQETYSVFLNNNFEIDVETSAFALKASYIINFKKKP